MNESPLSLEKRPKFSQQMIVVVKRPRREARRRGGRAMGEGRA